MMHRQDWHTDRWQGHSKARGPGTWRITQYVERMMSNQVCQDLGNQVQGEEYWEMRLESQGWLSRRRSYRRREKPGLISDTTKIMLWKINSASACWENMMWRDRAQPWGPAARPIPTEHANHRRTCLLNPLNLRMTLLFLIPYTCNEEIKRNEMALMLHVGLGKKIDSI